MRRKAQRLGCIIAPHHQHWLGHIQRNQRQSRGITGIVMPSWGRPLAVIEQISALKDKVVLVPKPLSGVGPQLFHHRLVQHGVVGLGPCANDLQRLPILAPGGPMSLDARP